ncbi:MAG TPA: hypothetical protein VFS27_09810, partial [Blastocatellia bacterium]|nr:hypothetical protein [Blastocatellia bacterium]
MYKRLVLAAPFVLATTFFFAGAWASARQGGQTPPAKRQGAPGAVSSDQQIDRQIGQNTGQNRDRGDIRQQSFEIVWRTVKEKHFDPAIGGVDWDKAHETYAPRVAAVKSDREFYLLLQEMLGLLRQSHFNVIPPESIISEDQTEKPPEDQEPSSGAVGIDLRLIGGAAVITRVEPDSSAARAGLRPGFVIKQIDDILVDQIFAAFAKSAEQPGIKNIRMTRSVLAAMGGNPGALVK